MVFSRSKNTDLQLNFCVAPWVYMLLDMHPPLLWIDFFCSVCDVNRRSY